jgi:hypothetical protein
MDPATAIGVASSAIAFLEFGLKLLSKGKELYQSKEGVLAEHAELSAVNDRLLKLSDGLDDSLRSIYKVQLKLSPAQQALHGAVEQCKAGTTDFALALNKLRVTGSHRKFKSFRQAFKSIWNKEEIQEKTAKMDRLRQDVMIHLLVVVQYASNTTSTPVLVNCLQ